MRFVNGDCIIDLWLNENKMIEVIMKTPIPTASGSGLRLNPLVIFFPKINQPIINEINEKPVESASGSNIDLNNRKSDLADVSPMITSRKPAIRPIVIPINTIVLIDIVFSFIYSS